MLCLLLQYSRENILPWKLLVLQRPAKMSLEHGFLSLELGIRFTSGMHKHWFLERFIRDISLVLYAWIRSENSVYYAFCTALWFGLKSLCWPRVGTLVLQWLRGWFPSSKGLAVLGRDPHEQAGLLQARAMPCPWCAPALLQATCTWGYCGALDPLANANVVLLSVYYLKIGLKTTYSHYPWKPALSSGYLLSQQPDLCRARSVAQKCQGCMPLEINLFFWREECSWDDSLADSSSHLSFLVVSL